jgi:hypothetical protein
MTVYLEDENFWVHWGRRAGGDRPRQFALIRRQGGPGVLRDLRAQPSPGGGRSGRPEPCRAIHHRNRPVPALMRSVMMLRSSSANTPSN